MSALQLYFDESSPTVQFSSVGWADNSSALWTSGKSKVVTQFPGAGLTFKFNGKDLFLFPAPHLFTISPTAGTKASFYGASLNGSTYVPTIDDLPQPEQTLPLSNPPSYGAWYNTPDLQPGTHSVVLKDLPMLTLDYIIVQVDPSTTFHNTPVLVSDSDPNIKYQGDWDKEFNRFRSLQPFTFVGDYSTRSSCNPGDSLSLDFSGTSISVWGVFDWMTTGSFTATYMLDGEQVAQDPHEATSDSQSRIFGVQTNFELFTHAGLEAKLHNLMIQITACQNQRFALDYITYTPTFTSGADKPSSSGSSSTTSPDTHSKSSTKFPVGAIVGIVVGALVLILGAGLLFWFLRTRRRRRRERRRADAEPFVTSTSASMITKKEEIPAHMRHLRSPGSQDTFPAGTVDLTASNGTTTNINGGGTWVIAPTQSEIQRNINELVVGGGQAPPAYNNNNNRPSVEATGTVTTDGQTEAPAPTNRNRSRS